MFPYDIAVLRNAFFVAHCDFEVMFGTNSLVLTCTRGYIFEYFDKWDPCNSVLFIGLNMQRGP